MRPLELLTAAPWHESTGDAAIEQVMVRELAARGVPVIPRSTATGSRTCVIGGGFLIRGDEDGQWGRSLAPYRVPGRHVLNGVSIASDGDFAYLRDYRLVSVRDRESREILARHVAGVDLVPCATVLAEPPPVEWHSQLPAHEHYPPPGTYHVRDVRADDVPMPFDGTETTGVDTRPWDRQSGLWSDFPNRTVDDLLVLLAGAKSVVAASLHLSILAMAVGTPFVVRELIPGKCWHYWRRAGFGEVVGPDTDGVVAKAERLHARMMGVRAREQDRAREHLDRIVDVLREDD